MQAATDYIQAQEIPLTINQFNKAILKKKKKVNKLKTLTSSGGCMSSQAST